MASYEDLMKGTQFGPMVIAGDAEGSRAEAGHCDHPERHPP